MKKFKSSLLIPLGVVLFIVFSCKKKENNPDFTFAHNLYESSVELYSAYIDSLVNTTDSASFYRLTEEFEKELTDLNFNFPPSTDMMLTEQENDSLIKLSDKYVKIKKEREKFILEALKHKNDPVPME